MIHYEIHNILKPGGKLTIKELREFHHPIYTRYGIHRKPKTTDLQMFDFKIKRITIAKDGKRQEAVMFI